MFGPKIQKGDDDIRLTRYELPFHLSFLDLALQKHIHSLQKLFFLKMVVCTERLTCIYLALYAVREKARYSPMITDYKDNRSFSDRQNKDRHLAHFS